MDDPYKTLGIKKNASSAEIKSAYRKLAKEHHPDLNSGNAEHFKSISGAYDVLSDKTMRARFDRGELDSGVAGQRPGPGFWRNWSEEGRANKQNSTGHSFNFDQFGSSGADIFSEIFKNNSHFNNGPTHQNNTQTASQNSKDTKYKLTVPFIEAATGIKKKVTLSDGKTVNMTIPSGTETGTKLRLKGQGKRGKETVAAGDAIIELTVGEHNYFTRKDNDIYLEFPVSIQEAILGAAIVAPTIHGNVTLKVPAGSNSGTKLRLKEKGINKNNQTAIGDQYVSLRVMLPEKIDRDLTEFVESWAKSNDYHPRKKLKID